MYNCEASVRGNSHSHYCATHTHFHHRYCRYELNMQNNSCGADFICCGKNQRRDVCGMRAEGAQIFSHNICMKNRFWAPGWPYPDDCSSQFNYMGAFWKPYYKNGLDLPSAHIIISTCQKRVLVMVLMVKFSFVNYVISCLNIARFFHRDLLWKTLR